MTEGRRRKLVWKVETSINSDESDAQEHYVLAVGPTGAACIAIDCREATMRDEGWKGSNFIPLQLRVEFICELDN